MHIDAAAKSTDEPLSEELKTYEQKKDGLAASSPGKYVLIKGAEIIGTYNKQYEAISDGYARFGNVPFFVKHLPLQ